jgi:hypothetical protein
MSAQKEDDGSKQQFLMPNSNSTVQKISRKEPSSPNMRNTARSIQQEKAKRDFQN